MKIEEFTLERIQSLYENTVEYNLSDSGVHPYSLRELLTPEQQNRLLDVELGYGWTNGRVELRQAIANLHPNRDPDHVIVTNGSAEANFLLVMSLLEPGDELVVFVPNYLQIWGWARAIGVTVKEVLLREELGWIPDLDDVRKAVSSRTKMMTICNPNNPTGSVLPRETMDGLVAIARQHGVYLHADEVYKGAELDQDEPPSFADLYEKAIVTNGLSKAMALPGLRIGWLACRDRALLARLETRKHYTTICNAAPSELIAAAALRRGAQIRARNRAIIDANLPVFAAFFAEWAERFAWEPPQAGCVCFPRYLGADGVEAFCRDLVEQAGVVLLPAGIFASALAPVPADRFRIGVGRAAPEPALAALGAFLRRRPAGG